MKLCVKRIYCPECRKLVRCREENADGKTNIVCYSCGSVIWVKNPVTWQYAAVKKAGKAESGEATVARNTQQ